MSSSRRSCATTLLAIGYWKNPTADDKKVGRQYYLRGLEHLEEFFRTAGKVPGGFYHGPQEYAYRYPTFELHLNDPSQPDAVAAAEKAREILFRILRKRVRDGYADEAWIVRALGQDLSKKEFCDFIYGLLVEFKDLPDLKSRIETYVMQKYAFDGYNSPEGDDLIEKLEKSDNRVLRGGGQWLRWRRGLDRPNLQKPEVVAGPRAIPDSQAAQFTPIQFPVIAGAGKGRTISGFLSCTAAGPRREIAWDRNHVYAIQGKDGLKELWSRLFRF